MKRIPADLITLLLALTPGEQVTCHYSDQRWKVEHETILHGHEQEGNPSPYRIGRRFLQQVLAGLPEVWRGSLTFYYEHGHWRVRQRNWPTLDQENRVAVDSLVA